MSFKRDTKGVDYSMGEVSKPVVFTKGIETLPEKGKQELD